MDHKLDTNDLITQLRPLVQGQPTREKWAAIVASFEDASLIKNRAARERALHYAQGAMRHWPPELRAIPETWKSFLTQKRQKTPHAGLALCKVIELEKEWLEPERTRAHRALSDEVFEHMAMACAPYRELEARHIQVLCSLPWMCSLESLNLAGNRIGDEGMRALMSCEEMTRLEELNVSHNRLTDHSLDMLTQSTHLSALKSLNLSHYTRHSFFYDSRLIDFARSPACSALRTLHIGGCTTLGTPAFRALIASPQREALEHLNMLQASLTSDAMEVFEVGGGAQVALRTLDLRGCGLGMPGIILWDELEGLAGLEELDVSDNMLFEESLVRLLQSPHLGRLETLRIHDNEVSARVMRALYDAPLPRLRRLVLGHHAHQCFEWSWLEQWLESPMCAQLDEVEFVGLELDRHMLDAFTRAQAARLK